MTDTLTHVDPLEEALIDLRDRQQERRLARSELAAGGRTSSDASLALRHSLDHYLAERLQDIVPLVQWVAEAITTGIIGNAAYDVIRRGLSSVKPARGRQQLEPRRIVEAAARLAVVERCRQLDMDAPPTSRLRVTSCTTTAVGCTVKLANYGRDKRFYALVNLPYRDFHGGRIEVQIWWAHPVPAAARETPEILLRRLAETDTKLSPEELRERLAMLLARGCPPT